MADKNEKPDPNAKPAPGSRATDIQRRARAMAARKPVSPQQFFQEALVELKKTTWPSRAVLTKSTTVVLALVVAVGVWVFLLTFLFSHLLGPLFGTGH